MRERRVNQSFFSMGDEIHFSNPKKMVNWESGNRIKVVFIFCNAKKPFLKSGGGRFWSLVTPPLLKIFD